MEKQLIIYTRTSRVDYGLLVSPSESFCPSSIRKVFREQIRGILNVDEYDPDISSPRWLFKRIGNLTLWGVACWNETHGTDCIADEVGRKRLRNFVGIIYKGDVSQLPYDLSYFSKEFNTHIAPIWNMSKQDIKAKEGVEADDYHGGNSINASVFPGLNLSPNIGVTHDVANAEKLFSAALASKAEVSVVSNIRDVHLAFDDRYKFMNACVIGDNGGRRHQYPSMKTQEKSPEKPQAEEIPPQPKKVYRPKIIALIGIITITLLVMAMCAKGTRKSKTSTSGEKEMKQDQKSSSPSSNTMTIKQKEKPI